MEAYGIPYFLEISIVLGVLGAIILTRKSRLMLRKYLAGGVCRSKALLHGKTVIITGSNSGIGKETARDLARRGARVILACRNLEKAEAAKRDIQTDCEGEVVVRKLDLSSFNSIREFANHIIQTESQVNILINNAGLLAPNKEKTEDGFDSTFQTNHLGPFLLTNLLLPKIKQSAPARIINVSSMVYEWGTMNWNDLNYDTPGSYDMMLSYNQSKLCNVLFTQELARRLDYTAVTTYALHPGIVESDLSRNLHNYKYLSIVLFLNFITFTTSKSVTQGAQTSIYCAVDEKLENQTGLYYSDCRERRLARVAKDREALKRLWDISVEMVGLGR